MVTTLFLFHVALLLFFVEGLGSGGDLRAAPLARPFCLVCVLRFDSFVFGSSPLAMLWKL